MNARKECGKLASVVCNGHKKWAKRFVHKLARRYGKEVIRVEAEGRSGKTPSAR